MRRTEGGNSLGRVAAFAWALAFRLDRPVVIAPTLASNDAPCSAVSVLDSPAGVSIGIEFYPCSPALVVVDTGIVAAASERFLVSGMGDAMATWYEASVCLRNSAAVTMVGARPTLAAVAIGEVCTAIPQANANHLHGEMVAMGTLAQLVIEQRLDEAHRVAGFFAQLGLPVHLGQLSIDSGDAAALSTIVEAALAFPFIGNMPMKIGAAVLRDGLLRAHELGVSVREQAGDVAYRRLHAD